MQDKKLKLSDTLDRALPDYPNKPVAKRITIHHLLTHTSGLGDFFGPEYLAKHGALVTLKDYLPLFVSKPLAIEPGAKFEYSNAGYIVLGLVIEKLSVKNYFDYVKS